MPTDYCILRSNDHGFTFLDIYNILHLLHRRPELWLSYTGIHCCPCFNILKPLPVWQLNFWYVNVISGRTFLNISYRNFDLPITARDTIRHPSHTSTNICGCTFKCLICVGSLSIYPVFRRESEPSDLRYALAVIKEEFSATQGGINYHHVVSAWVRACVRETRARARRHDWFRAQLSIVYRYINMAHSDLRWYVADHMIRYWWCVCWHLSEAA